MKFIIKHRLAAVAIFALLFTLMSCEYAPAQQLHRITTPCPSPSRLFSFVAAQVDGTIRQQACAGHSNIFTGTVDFSGATVIGITGTSPLTTKGDIYGFSTVNARIPVGTNLQVLIADSAQALGVRWGAVNLPGGLGGSIPYQSAANTTAMLANGTAGQVLTSNGTTLAPSWTTISSGGITGSGTAGFLPKFTAGTVVGNSRVSDTGAGAATSITLNSGAGATSIGDTSAGANRTRITLDDSVQTIDIDGHSNGLVRLGDVGAAGNSTFLVLNDSTKAVSGKTIGATGTILFDTASSATTGGVFKAGQITATLGGNNTLLTVDDTLATASLEGNTVNLTASAGAQAINLNSGLGQTTIGRVGTAFTRFRVDGTAATFSFLGTNTTLNAQALHFIQLERTITPAGTTGAQTIDKQNGSVNFAAGASSLVVTSSTTVTTTLIIATAQTNDATCFVANVVPAAGSFTIRMTAPCTAETRVAFWQFN